VHVCSCPQLATSQQQQGEAQDVTQGSSTPLVPNGSHQLLYHQCLPLRSEWLLLLLLLPPYRCEKWVASMAPPQAGRGVWAGWTWSHSNTYASEWRVTKFLLLVANIIFTYKLAAHMNRVVSGVGRRDYAVGQTYVDYGVGRKMEA
jgi:hypothetical protein